MDINLVPSMEKTRGGIAYEGVASLPVPLTLFNGDIAQLTEHKYCKVLSINILQGVTLVLPDNDLITINYYSR